MKNKSFLSKLEELKPEVPVHLEVERKLIPRIKFMGYVMVILTLASIVFALIVKEEIVSAEDSFNIELSSNKGFDPSNGFIPDEAELEFVVTEVLNFYIVGAIFALVGASCFLIAWKKSKILLPHTHHK